MPILLKAGMVLCHDETDQVVATKADVLIQGSRITRIADSISPPTGTEIIDCTDKLVSPGFVDTHHHVWQSAFKGVFGDMALLPYLAMSTFISVLSNFNIKNAHNHVAHASGLEFTERDMFWSNLSDNMEALDAGTTTTLDHAHMNWSQHHSESCSLLLNCLAAYFNRRISYCWYSFVRNKINLCVYAGITGTGH